MKLTIDEINKVLESMDPLQFTDAQVDRHTHGARISAGKRGVPINVGRPVSELAKQRASEVHSGKVVSAATKSKLAAARTAQLAERYSNQKATCQHCGEVNWPAHITRFHADGKCLEVTALKAFIRGEIDEARAAGSHGPALRGAFTGGTSRLLRGRSGRRRL